MVYISVEEPAAGVPPAGFYLDEREVTVADFRTFVTETGYVTEAEQFGWSGVFSTDSLAWLPVDSANWRYPLGPAAPPAAPQEPVVQVSFRDATAYAEWAGKRLPTAAEWTYAASQGGEHVRYPWGEEMVPDGEYLGNWWQGPFPFRDEVLDEYPGIAPVKQFPPTANGLYDIAGNVWEWTTTEKPGSAAQNPEMVIKGGSFLCSASYCVGFDLQAQQFTPQDSGLNHLGFRCAKDT